jgi:sigma-E factor negative regulatory protein RseA
MSDPTGREKRLQDLSAMADGRLGDAEASRLCRDWRDDPELRVTWHAYHLIGDVMRSDDLAKVPRHDEAFLRALRQRLVDEPVVMAPAATVAAMPSARRRRAWLAPAAVAAGFVAVAGVLVVTRMADPTADRSGMLASGPAVPTGVVRVSAGAMATAPAAPAAVDDMLIRDARLDRYLEAHRQYGSVTMVPGGVVRSTATAAPQR